MDRAPANRDAALRRLRRVNLGLAAASVLGAGGLMALVASNAAADHHATSTRVLTSGATPSRSASTASAAGTTRSAAGTAKERTAAAHRHTLAASAAPQSSDASSGSPSPVRSGAS